MACLPASQCLTIDMNSYLEAAAIKRKKMGTGFHCHVVLLSSLAVVLHCCAASDVSKGMIKYDCAVPAQQHWVSCAISCQCRDHNTAVPSEQGRPCLSEQGRQGLLTRHCSVVISALTSNCARQWSDVHYAAGRVHGGNTSQCDPAALRLGRLPGRQVLLNKLGAVLRQRMLVAYF
jgi:hypothetical protein